MPVHTYHEGLPDYDPDAILQHGCAECADRAGIHGLGWFDPETSARLMRRAAAWNRDELQVNPTEARLFADVWTVVLWLRNNRIDVLEEVPRG